MPTRLSRAIAASQARPRLALTAIAVVLAAGATAVLVGFAGLPAGAHGTDDTVLVVLADPNAQRTADELARDTSFTWKIADSARQPDVNPVAVVTLTGAADPVAENSAVSRIRIEPARYTPDEWRYTRLMQVAYEATVRASVGQLLDAVSQARIKINAASFITTAMDGELKDATSNGR